MKIVKIAKSLITYLVTFLLASSLYSCAEKNVKKDDFSSMSKYLVPFIKKEDKQLDLYVTDLEGKTKVRLTNDAFDEADPIVTQSGKIMFSSKRTGTWQLYIINPDGSDLKAITNDKGFNNYRPSVTIDGSVLFVSDRETKPKIFVMDADGSNVTKLTDDDNYYDFPSPLDDGSILYLSNEKNKWEIWNMNADGSHKRKITTMTNKPLSLTAMPGYVKDYMRMIPLADDSFLNKRSQELVSFTAKAIFVARDKKGDVEIFRINLDGSDLRNLSQMPGMDSNPIVLKNGKIAFTSDRDGIYDVWLMEPDGYNPVNLTRDVYYASTR